MSRPLLLITIIMTVVFKSLISVGSSLLDFVQSLSEFVQHWVQTLNPWLGSWKGMFFQFHISH